MSPTPLSQHEKLLARNSLILIVGLVGMFGWLLGSFGDGLYQWDSSSRWKI